LASSIEHDRVDLSSLVTHRFSLDDIDAAFDLFSSGRDRVLKVALYPDACALAAARH
jgi:alcohol dehydrogenase